MRVRVVVTPKPGVLDPEGRAVQHALKELGYSNVSEVLTGKVIDLEIATDDAERARTLAVEMCEKLLANPVIETYSLEVE